MMSVLPDEKDDVGSEPEDEIDAMVSEIFKLSCLL